MSHALTLRDLVAALVLGAAAGFAWLALERLRSLPVNPPPPVVDPAGHDVWRVLDEARKITIEAAIEQGF